jgi:hypothetical protein
MDAQDQVNDLSSYYHLVFMHFAQLFRCNIDVALGYILPVPKVKFPLGHIMKTQRGSRGIPVLFFNLDIRCGVSGKCHTPVALSPRKETQYSYYRRLGGPQGQSGQVLKTLPPLQFDCTPSSP